MHIKSLEIAGFKSFVDRTVIHFDHDVVGIVGPNGCGKSNVVDAIRWCMGEQSARHLRGRKMEDVIFNGSESRGPHGLAEVTLVFDNTDPRFVELVPVEYRDYPEIAITRRLFRDGTSEYLINKTYVRLRDVTDLFLGTGVGTKAYSVVEQGRIGQIVSARPEDRRLFIEEAAGITKYKARRRQAEQRMELTRQNLVRVTDIVTEIDRTRASLKRQVAKAERFLKYRSELEDLLLYDASHRLLELIVTERASREALDAASKQAADLRGRLRDAESTLDETRTHAARIETLTDAASRAAFQADNEVTALHAEMERSRDRLGHLTERMGAGKLEADDIALKSAGLRGEHADLVARIEGLGSDEQARAADAAAEDQALEALRSEESQAVEELGTLRRQAADSGRIAAAVDARLDGFVQRIAEAHVRRDRLVAERDTLSGEVRELEAKQGALERSVAELAEGKRLTEAEREALARELDQLRQGQLASERSVDAQKNELSIKRNRLRALQDLHRRLEGVGAGVRALLSKSDPAVLGMVADRIEAPEELTSAFAGLLGERLQTVVVTDLGRGIELLEELRGGERGRASIVSAGRAAAAERATPPEGDPELLGLLRQRLRYAPEDEALVMALVGDALLAKSASDALSALERHPGFTFVALDGSVVRPDGTISGGSGDDVAAAMVEQKREMHALVDEVSRLDARLKELVDAQQALRARMTEAGTSLDRARQVVHEGELAHVTAQKDLGRTAFEIERASLRRAAIDQELAEIDRSVEEATRNDSESRQELDRLRAELEHTQHSLVRAEQRAASWKERVAIQATLVTERQVRLAQVREQMEAARAARDRLDASLDELRTRIQRLDEEMADAAASYGETAARLVIAREARALANLGAQAAHAELDRTRAELEQVRNTLFSRESELKRLREELAAFDDQVRGHELSLQRIELEHTHLLRSIRERFRGLELHRVVGDYHSRPRPDDEQRRRTEELTQLIDRMGPVNLDAKTEWEEAERRFESLSKQKIDIEKALEDLEKAIKHMNRESRRRFKETFDGVNELFKKTFKIMFRGGRAELMLTNPEDLLETGVDIIAQPPGKKLGTIDLMSGGEKALTAVSLIFAIFQYRPSPFCVLDEVDAPLDEANVARYNEAIRSMTNSSQFILITHVKKTMEMVDVLYGVTMGEPGVSRIVSVKVNANAVTRSDSRVIGGVRSTQGVADSAEAGVQSGGGATQVA